MVPPSDGQCHISHTHTQEERKKERERARDREHTLMPKNNSQVVCFTPLTRPLPPYTHTHTCTALLVQTTQTKQETLTHPFSIFSFFCTIINISNYLM